MRAGLYVNIQNSNIILSQTIIQQILYNEKWYGQYGGYAKLIASFSYAIFSTSKVTFSAHRIHLSETGFSIKILPT